MSDNPGSSARRVARVISKALAEGHVIDIDGLGVFRPRKDGAFDFVANTNPRVFIGYVVEDLRIARRLYTALEDAHFQPWLDREKLLPGQNWPRSIERAIDVADFFVPCFSRRSATKRGTFQSELRYALDCANRLPLEDIFILPVRLDECEVPTLLANRIQYVDLFPDWDRGVRRLIKTMRRETVRRGSLLLAS
jgi:hypothetical protein